MSAVTHSIAAVQGWLCWYCAATMTPKTVTKDHVTPRCRGGTSEAANLVAACIWCNLTKSDLDPCLFLELRLHGLEQGWWPAGQPVLRHRWRKHLRRHLQPDKPEYLNLALPGDQVAA